MALGVDYTIFLVTRTAEESRDHGSRAGLLVRTVVVPAIAVRLGDRFWWPRKVSRS